jgi:hypothetical protein
MKIDLYTKIILTGILACLCLLVLRDVPLENIAEAQGGAGQQVIPVVITGVSDGPGGKSGPLPVIVVR